MSPERWQQIKALFESAMDVEPERRSKYVSDICGNDAELRREVESLLESERVPGMIRDDSGLLAARALQDGFQDHDPMIGRNVGAYRIERLLGNGGMGAVYLASGNNAADQQAVAVKVIKRGFDTAGVIRRFRRERQILSNLDHKYIARILEGGACDDGQPYFVMEYIEGRSIDHYVEDRELPVADRLRLFMKVCAAVDAAHRNGIVHRDIKPGNVAMVAITASRIKTAEKQPNAALQDLNSLLPSLQRNGAVRLEFEIRLAQCETMLKSDKRSEAQMCSASLGRDSLAKGFKAVAQKAAELAR
jgi:eukaryotic-like serine/threonine-protein kinase